MRLYNPVSNQEAYSVGYRNLMMRSMIENANVRDLAHSWFIQAVDVAAYLLYQQLAPSSYFGRKAGQNYFNRLDPIMCKVASPKTGGIVRL